MEDDHSLYSAGELGPSVYVSVRKGTETQNPVPGQTEPVLYKAKPYESGNLNMALLSSGPGQKTEQLFRYFEPDNLNSRAV